MHVYNSTRTALVMVAGVLAAASAIGSASAATAKPHADKICWHYSGGPKGGMTPGPCPEPEKVAAVAPRSDKICWRYYGGPKGGMWPGACTE